MCCWYFNTFSNNLFSSSHTKTLKLLGHKKVVELLITRGADVNSVNNRKLTPLHRAATYGIFKSEINNYSSVFNANFKFKGFVEIAELLIHAGAHVNAKDERQNTPLHLIVGIQDSAKQFAIAELLIKNGADKNIKNADDKTPLDLANNERGNFVLSIIKRVALFIIICINFFPFQSTNKSKNY